MTFAYPLVLWLLVPVGGLTLYLLVGKRQRVDVPFVDLWRGPAEPVKRQRAWRLPPAGVILALLATVAAIMAGAGPEYDSPFNAEKFTIIVDRGVTASARGSRGYRFHEWAERGGPLVVQNLGPGPVRLVVLPGAARDSDASDWAGLVQELTPTNVRTEEMVRQAVAAALRETRGPVVVLTDHGLGMDDERVVVLSPGDSVRNAGLVRVAVRERPAGQVMVRVRNQGAPGAAVLRVTGTTVLEVAVTLPAAGEQDYFLDLPQVSDRVKVELVAADQLTVDNVAWLVRQREASRVEARGPVRAELVRLIERYNALRQGRDDQRPVAVYRDAQTIPADGPAILVSAASATRTEGTIDVTAHPAIAGASGLAQAMGLPLLSPPPADLASWTVLVRVGGQPAVAVREGAARQAWVGFWSDEFAATAPFVVFWAGLMDWVGRAADGEFTGSPLEEFSGEWTLLERFGEGQPAPGLYRQGDVLRAFNLIDVKVPEARAADWAGALGRVRRGVKEEKRGPGLGMTMSLLALALAGGAALAWTRETEPNVVIPGGSSSR